jgi:hypothetical protein
MMAQQEGSKQEEKEEEEQQEGSGAGAAAQPGRLQRARMPGTWTIQPAVPVHCLPC